MQAETAPETAPDAAPEGVAAAAPDANTPSRRFYLGQSILYQGADGVITAVQQNGKEYVNWTYNIEVGGAPHEKIPSGNIGMEVFSDDGAFDDEYFDEG